MESAAAIKEIRERDQIRRIFNRTATTVEAHIRDHNLSQASLDIDFLLEKYTRLETLQTSIQDKMLGTDQYNEEEFAKEMDAADKIRYRWCTIRHQLQRKISPKTTMGQTEDVNRVRNFRLPNLEFKKFDDNVRNWLAFWGQFKKIHEHQSINEQDKFQYLLQSLKEDSSARALVESFPPSAENYLKAVEQLQARFGREDMLIQVYVRELLGLVLNHSKSNVSVRELYDKLSTYLLSLETLGIVKQKYETILYPLVESAIPEAILVAWNRANTDHVSTNQLANLLQFLKCEVETEERIKLARSDFNCASTNTTFHRELRSTLPAAASLLSNVKEKESSKEQFHNVCCFCDRGGHSTLECSKTAKMSLEEKKEAIKRRGCCYICLRKGHMANKCKLFIKCMVCDKRHNVILCPELHKRESPRTSENVLVCAKNNTTTLLQTLIVNVTYNKKCKKVRILLDSGSQRSYVKAALVKELGLQQIGTEKIGHTLFGGVEQPAEVYKCYDILVSSLDNSFCTKINALQQSEICGHLPKIKNMNLLKKLRNLNIEISDLNCPDTEISILVGSDYLGSIITNKLVDLGNNLMAVYTNLGWTLQGPIEVQNTVNTTSVSCFSKTNLSDLWSVELLGIHDPYEKQCGKETETEILNVFNNNISVDAQGRYEVSLLWKEGCPELSTNYEVACKRLESTTKKLKSTGNLKIYNHVLHEWKKDDIIEKVTDDNINVGHYIPHHSVFKPSSTSTRVRPVYDASAKDRNGWSLNGCLDKGINMIELLPKLLIQFRKGTYGVVSDIKQAFLQIAITEEDRDYLKFLWWDDIETCDKIVTYRHKRVVFGITCSPFLLSATIRYHLDKCAEVHKQTAARLKESFYVDNCVTSFETVDELNTFITESRAIMAEGMFDLRGWVTAPHRIDDTVAVPVLGMTWNTLQDDLRCNVNIIETTPQKITKRYVISVAQHVFDPLGLVCCATLIPKLVIQKIWEHKVDWDQEIPTDLAQEFKDWLKTAHLINQCRFPRHLSAAPVEVCETSLHIFSDACQTSFAGCLFLRTQLNERVQVQLILAKNRVAPANKKMALPRLELMGALIASRLYKEVMESGLLAHCTNYKVYFWTDSAVVLAWIKRQTQWKIFVSNRVKEICTTTNCNDWHHIPGKYNQADLPSRGCDAKKLLESRWWEGWLKSDWPKSDVLNVNEEVVQAEAVHLELVESLSTDSFIMALRRFIARRGRIRVIYTDCGSNFQGAANLLETVSWTEVEAASAALVTPIRWRFLPPRAPWWERLIRILKEMLRRILVLENDKKDVENQTEEDPLTKAIGALGKWQIWICFVVFLVKFPVAWHQMSIIFLAPPMNFTCASAQADSFDNVCYANCTDYEYDHRVFQETIVSQWDLVCDKQWLKNLTQTIFMLGILVGNMMFGHLSDRFGRRNPFLAAVFLQLISGVTTAYSVNWYMFTTLRFFLAVATGGTMVTSFVLTMELIGAKYRDTVGIIYQIPFNLGHLTLPLFGYYLRDWSTFQLAISLPSVLFLSYYFLLPESPRWLLTAGRSEEAVKIMEVAAKRNGRPTDGIASTTQKMVVDVSGKQDEHASFLALFRTPKLRARTIAICFNWFVCGLCFFGVSQYMSHISGDIFTNVAISAAIQVPGTIISVYLNRLLGRKVTLISANCVTGLSCLLIIVVPQSGVSHLTLGCTGLWGMSISFATVYLYAGELFPTVVRNSGVGLSSTVARIGSMVAPFVATLAHTSAWLPPLAFGIVPLIGAGLCFLLPDTRGRKLPDTLEEGEA